MTVSADLPGIVEKIEFESGQSVPAGAVLVRLDTKQEEAQLAAAEAASRRSPTLNLKRAKDLVAQGIQAQADLDRLAARAETGGGQGRRDPGDDRRARRSGPRSPACSGSVRSISASTSKAGAAIVPLQAIRPVYVNFSVPQQQVAT